MNPNLDQLMQDVRNSREVFVTPEGEVEDKREAELNAAREKAEGGVPQPRTRLKPAVFGGASQGSCLNKTEKTA